MLVRMMYSGMLLANNIVVLFMHKPITCYMLCTLVYILYATTEVTLDMGRIIHDESGGIYVKQIMTHLFQNF
jgi:hypothetical protein